MAARASSRSRRSWGSCCAPRRAGTWMKPVCGAPWSALRRSAHEPGTRPSAHRHDAAADAAMRLLVALLAGCAVTAAAAQQPAPQQTIDRVVAVVGTRPILASQIEEEMVQAQAQGQPIPPDSAGRMVMRRQILDRLIELEILVQQAERDTSIKVTDQEVLDQVEQTYQNVRKQFASESDFRDQIRQARFGSVEEWRRWLADEQRRQLYAQRLIEAQRQKGKLRPIPPTEAQMREFWEQNKAQQPRRPATVSFRQIVVRPVPVRTRRSTRSPSCMAIHKSRSWRKTRR